MRLELEESHLSLVDDDKAFCPIAFSGLFVLGFQVSFTFEDAFFCPGWTREDEGVFLDFFIDEGGLTRVSFFANDGLGEGVCESY